MFRNSSGDVGSVSSRKWGGSGSGSNSTSSSTACRAVVAPAETADTALTAAVGCGVGLNLVQPAAAVISGNCSQQDAHVISRLLLLMPVLAAAAAALCVSNSGLH